jgi:hypothetical protein
MALIAVLRPAPQRGPARKLRRPVAISLVFLAQHRGALRSSAPVEALEIGFFSGAQTRLDIAPNAILWVIVHHELCDLVDASSGAHTRAVAYGLPILNL